MLEHLCFYCFLGGERSGGFRVVGDSLGIFELAQLEQIPVALLLHHLHDRYRLTEQPIALRGTGPRRECIGAREVPTRLRVHATSLASSALVVGVEQLGDVPQQTFSKTEDESRVRPHSGLQLGDAMAEIKPPCCELLPQPLVTPKPCTRDAPLLSIAQDRSMPSIPHV